MTPLGWPCPQPDGSPTDGFAEEYALAFDKARKTRLLIVPALFDEGNRMRRFTVEVMRRLDAAGIDSVLPDLPGCNESLQPLERQEVSDWRAAIAAAARHYGATHTLGIRGGCLFTPDALPTWHYAPIKAASILRQMLRARLLASREAGQEERREDLIEAAQTDGIELVGYSLGAAFYRAFNALVPTTTAQVIEQERIGGAGLWLRAEPDENAEHADTLAAILATELRA